MALGQSITFYLKVAAAFLLFDARYYLLMHPDIGKAYGARAIVKSFWHFRRYGSGEGRAFRRTPVGLQYLRSLCSFFSIEKNYLSGINLKYGSQSARAVSVFILSMDRFRLRKIYHAKIAQADLLGDRIIQLNWNALPQSAGKRYLVFALRGLRPTPFALNFSVLPPIFSDPASVRDVPRSLCISPVTQCNLNCVHCITRYTRTQVRELSDEKWGEIRDLIKSGEIKAISSDYSGDVFFSSRRRQPWFDRFIEADCAMRFDTHANDLTPEVAKKLIASKLASINFSIDTMDPADYAKIRIGSIPHGEVIENIAGFMALRNRHRRDIEVILSFGLMKRNIETLFAAIDLAKELDVSFIQGNHVIVMTEDVTEQSLALTPLYYNDVFDRLTAYAKERGVVLILPQKFESAAARVGHKPCVFPWEGAILMGNGDVMACCMPGSKMGNLNQSSLKEIWNGKNYHSFRAKVNSDAPPKICTTCPIYRHSNNFRSYVTGLDAAAQAAFEARCLDAHRLLAVSA